MFWLILIAIIIVLIAVSALIKLLMKGTIAESLETYSPSAYSLVANDVFLTACLAVKGNLQFYEKNGVVDTLEDIKTDKVRNVIPLGSCANVFDVEELYVKVQRDAHGRVLPQSPTYGRRGIEESYKTMIGATNVAGIAEQIQQDVTNRKLYRVYRITENGKIWNKSKTCEFIKALDILRRLRGFDRLGNADNGDYIMFPFVPVGNMMDVYSEEFLKEFIEGHNHRWKRRNFLTNSKLQYAPDKWPDVWQDSKWSEDDELLIMGSDGQLRPPVEHESKPVPHTIDELGEWVDTHLGKPNANYKYLEDTTHFSLVKEISECQNLADKWVYVRMLFEKFIAGFKMARSMTTNVTPEETKTLTGLKFMARMLPDEMRQYILYQMPLTLKEQILLFNTNNMLPFIQDNIVDKSRLGIQQEVVKICIAKMKQTIDGFIQGQDLSDETLSALNVIEQLLDDNLNSLDFERLNKHRKELRDAKARQDKSIGRRAKEEQEREEREKREKEQQKQEKKRKKEEADKNRPLVDADKLKETVEQATVFASVMAPIMQQALNPNRPATQPGSEDKRGEEGSDKEKDSDNQKDEDKTGK